MRSCGIHLETISLEWFEVLVTNTCFQSYTFKVKLFLPGPNDLYDVAQDFYDYVVSTLLNPGDVIPITRDPLHFVCTHPCVVTTGSFMNGYEALRSTTGFWLPWINWPHRKDWLGLKSQINLAQPLKIWWRIKFAWVSISCIVCEPIVIYLGKSYSL